MRVPRRVRSHFSRSALRTPATSSTSTFVSHYDVVEALG